MNTNFVSMIKNLQLPEKLHDTERENVVDLFSTPFIETMEKFKIKDDYQYTGNYVVITLPLIQSLYNLFKDKKVVEVMSGTGLLAYHLRNNGLNNFIATDNNSWGLLREKPPITPIIQIDAVEAVKAHPDADIILMCWPPFDNNIAEKVLDAMKVGQTLICCGERNGCTGTTDFWNKFNCDVIDLPYEPLFTLKDKFYIGIKE